MNRFRKILRLYFAMPAKEKTVVLGLILLFFFSLSRFLFGSMSFSVEPTQGVFAEGMVGHISAINPLLIDFQDADRDVAALVFSGLMRYDPVQKNFFPDLATNYTRSSTGKIYTLALRTDAKWHDGRPVTVDDVLFTFQLIQDPGFRNPILKNMFDGVIVKNPEPYVVTFTLPQANSYFLSNLTLGIVPKHILENTPAGNLEKSSFTLNPVGSGPYQVSSVRLDNGGDRVDLIAWPEYYGEKPKLQKIRLYTFPDTETLLDEAGALHSLAKLSQTSAAELTENSRFQLSTYTLNQFTAVFFNTESPFLKDAAVRRALRIGLNKNEFMPKDYVRVDRVDLQNYEQDSLFAWNETEAKKALDAAGLPVKPEGLRASLTLLTSSRQNGFFGTALQEQWKRLGIDVRIEEAEGAELTNRIRERQYDMLLLGQNLGLNRDLYPLLHSSQARGAASSQSGLNFSNYKSFGTDGLTEAIRKESDPENKEKLLKELGKVLDSEAPILFLGTPVYSYALPVDLGSFPAAELDYHADRHKILPYLSHSL